MPALTEANVCHPCRGRDGIVPFEVHYGIPAVPAQRGYATAVVLVRPLGGSMNIVYTYHARLRMRQRSISEDEVEAVIGNADTRYTDPDGNPCYVRTISGRRLKVVVEPGSNPPVVITVMHQV